MIKSRIVFVIAQQENPMATYQQLYHFEQPHKQHTTRLSL